MRDHHNVQLLDVEQIEFDTDNPRIKKALEKFGTNLDPERIYFALKTASNGSNQSQSSSFDSLRDSIQSSKRIVVPIVVARRNGGYVCIDGNTRLAIYKDFIKHNTKGAWSQIPATVLDNPSQREIEVIRVAAHLVGAREWPAYEKARYLHHLRNADFLEYAEIIALCGGNKADIECQVAAYEDMNDFYRDQVDDAAFRIDRFSGFVELQKKGVKEAIFEANLDLTDFGEWIRDGKIYRLADVRHLRKVLKDPAAREIFLTGGPRSIEDAIKYVEQSSLKDQPTKKILLNNASVSQLATTLAEKINNLPYSRFREYQQRSDETIVNELESLDSLMTQIDSFLTNVAE